MTAIEEAPCNQRRDDAHRDDEKTEPLAEIVSNSKEENELVESQSSQ